jgi:hypothetical protein
MKHCLCPTLVIQPFQPVPHFWFKFRLTPGHTKDGIKIRQRMGLVERQTSLRFQNDAEIGSAVAFGFLIERNDLGARLPYVGRRTRWSS